MAGEILYYLDDYTDEVMPCEPTLAGWATWLSLPGEKVEDDFAGRGDIDSGTVFAASALEVLEDVTVTKTADGWSYSREVEADATFFAERSGRGWDAENAGESLAHFCECQEDFAVDVGDEILVAVARDLPRVLIRFDRALNGPQCTIEATVQ